MCSNIFIRSTIYLLGVWRNGVRYIFLHCANISILTVTKITDMNRVVGRSVCTLLRDSALGMSCQCSCQSSTNWYVVMFQRNLRGHARASYNGVSGRFLSFSLPGPQRITLVSCRSFSSTTYLKNEAMPLPSKDKVILCREIRMMIPQTIKTSVFSKLPMMIQRNMSNNCIYKHNRSIQRRSRG